MRLFISIFIPDDINKDISDLIDSLKKNKEMPEGIRFTSYENQHPTLCFLGDQPPKNLELIKKSLDEIKNEFSNQKELVINMTRVSFYPPGSRSRMIWLWDDSRQSVGLENLKKVFEEKLIQKGVIWQKEGPGRFKAHITLARFKQGKRLPYMNIKFKSIFRIKRLDLMRSYLKPDGPVYEKIYSVDLIND